MFDKEFEGLLCSCSTVLGALSGGDSMEVISEDYQLTAAQISSALEFSSDITDFQTASYEGVA
ncbi:MAG: DUF433 domain-containing protein [Verrucomicrobia bacterium]|jgi:uncharacterized protein (DUF433 family)|nr:DUF433 domain-containing protein [Verrucomicrobiota bacterium]|tara:strand:- start:36029 stop:36217 length:189 start_codon:yes stop_codon:yes gene_type:complete